MAGQISDFCSGIVLDNGKTFEWSNVGFGINEDKGIP